MKSHEEHNIRVNVFKEVFKILHDERDYWDANKETLPYEDDWRYREAEIEGALQAIQNVYLLLADKVTK